MELNFMSENNSQKMQDIIRCLTNLLSIPSGSIPLSRRLGLDWANLSKIPQDMENDIATDIVGKVDEFEPRVSVSEVTFSYDEDGMATANILLEEGDEFGD